MPGFQALDEPFGDPRAVVGTEGYHPVKVSRPQIATMAERVERGETFGVLEMTGMGSFLDQPLE